MILVIGLYREASNFRERVGNELRPVHVPPFRPWMPPKRHSSQFSRVKSNCKACHISRYKISLFSVVFFAYSEHSARAKISMRPRGWPLGWVRIPVHFKHSLSATPAHNLRYIGILFFLMWAHFGHVLRAGDVRWSISTLLLPPFLKNDDTQRTLQVINRLFTSFNPLATLSIVRYIHPLFSELNFNNISQLLCWRTILLNHLIYVQITQRSIEVSFIPTLVSCRLR